MTKNKIVYVICILITWYISIEYVEAAPKVFLILEFIVGFLSFGMWIYFRGKLKAELLEPVNVVETGETMYFDAIVYNNSKLPVLRCDLKFIYKNELSSKKESKIINCSIPPNQKLRLSIPIKSMYCGQIFMNLASIRVYDYLKLFSKRIKTNKIIGIVIMPKMQNIDMRISNSVRNFMGESEEYSKTQKGDDLSEIFDIREYKPGDKIQNIHWKMSAKTDEIMVKDLSMPVGCGVGIFINLNDSEVSNDYNSNLNIVLESVISISFSLLMQKCKHIVVWSDGSSKMLSGTVISKEEHFFELVQRLLYNHPVEDSEFIVDKFWKEYKTVSLVHMYVITNNLSEDNLSILSSLKLVDRKSVILTAKDIDRTGEKSKSSVEILENDIDKISIEDSKQLEDMMMVV